MIPSTQSLSALSSIPKTGLLSRQRLSGLPLVGQRSTLPGSLELSWSSQFPSVTASSVAPPVSGASVGENVVGQTVVDENVVGNTSVGMRSTAVSQVKSVPVDYFADPDGEWEYEPLLEAANVNPAWGKVTVGALTEPFLGFPEGAAVVTLTTGDRQSVVLVDCTRSQTEAACVAPRTLQCISTAA